MLNCQQTLFPLRVQRVSGLLEKRLDWVGWEGGGMKGCLDGEGAAGGMERRLVKETQKVWPEGGIWEQRKEKQ